ncbi:MAG TPA: hypothetical protein VNM22_12185 [Candidatus Limnocylindrales bacterium]|nr:hypothetical protein [Candidatus Limnocylindrales bacterium]
MILIWKFWPIFGSFLPFKRTHIGYQPIVSTFGRRIDYLSLLLGCFGVGSHIILFALMIMRYAPVYFWPDPRLWYYPLPFQAVLVFSLLLLLNRFMPALNSRQVAFLNFFLFVIILSNIFHWVSYRNVMLSTPWFYKVYDQSSHLKQSLQDGKAYNLKDAYRLFYQYYVHRFPSLKSRAYLKIKENDGDYYSEMFTERAFVWPQKTTFLEVNVKEGGLYKIRVTFLVLPDAEPGIVSPYVNDQILGTFEVPQTISIALKEFTLVLALPGGEAGIRLKSELSEKEGGLGLHAGG